MKMGNKPGRIRETRKKLKVLIREHEKISKLHRSSSTASSCSVMRASVDDSCRQSILDVSMRSSEDEHSAFVTAAQIGCLEMVKLLLNLGVPINVPDTGGWTALHAAVDSGHLDVTEFLLANGSRVNTGTDDGTTCLHLAAQRGFVEIAKLLSKYEAEVNAPNRKGATPLFYAVEGGHLEVKHVHNILYFWVKYLSLYNLLLF